MKLEVGQEVELNNGEVHEVTEKNKPRPEFKFGPFVIDGALYHEDGRFAKAGLDYSLSVKRIIKEPDSKPEWPDLSNPDKVPFEDMTDEQQAFMLLAHYRGEGVEWWYVPEQAWLCKSSRLSNSGMYRLSNSGMYRLKPAAPSWLPLEVGKVYVDEGGVERRCIGVEGDRAYLVRNKSDDVWAYVWDASTGKAKHLVSEITGPAENTEGEN